MTHFQRNFRIVLFVITITLLPATAHAQNIGYSWLSSMGGNDLDVGLAIDTDENGAVFTTGYFLGTADFDPSPTGTLFLSTSPNDQEVFVSKLNGTDGSLAFAFQIGSQGNDLGRGIAVSNAGDIFLTGSFEQTVDFDPGASLYNLSSAGSSDIFIMKLNGSGILQWAVHFGDVLADSGNDIAVDEEGNVYVTGFFEGTVDFDPGSQNYSLTAGGVSDSFVLKLDNNGNFLWAAQFGGSNNSGTEEGYSIAVDGSGNVYTTGYFTAFADFYPGPATYNYTPFGLADVYVSKLDAAGNFVWAKQIGGTQYEVAYSLDVDFAGNSVITGFFNATTDFDPGSNFYNLTALGAEDAYLLKLDSGGNLVFAYQFGDVGQERGEAVKMDASGNIYLTGYFLGTVDFDPGVNNSFLTADGSTYDIFLLKLNAQGNFIFAARMGGSSGYSYPTDLVIGPGSGVHLCGYYELTADFDPGTNIVNQTSAGFFDVFVLKLIDGTVGLDDFLNSSLTVFPNPSNGKFQLELVNFSNDIQITIYNLAGKAVHQQNYSKSSLLNFQLNLKPGQYLIEAKSAEGIISFGKIIIE